MSNRRQARVLLILGAALLVFVLAWMLLARGEKATTTGPDAEPWSEETLDAKPTPKPTPTALPTKAGGLPNMAGLPTAGVPGLSGNGITRNAEPHRVTVSVKSDAPMVYAGWRVPSGQKSGGGKASTGFTTTVTGYGPPDWAQIFVTAGPGSRRTECTITVDGRVTEHRVATGPYAYLFCQG